MCRQYGYGQTAYVRACYVTGAAGMRVPVAEADWNDHGTHLRCLSSTASKHRRVRESLCPRCGRPLSDCRDRCIGR